MAPFAVILNVQQKEGEPIKESTKAKVQGDAKDKQDELFYRLDLHNLHERSCRWRMRVFKINVLALSGDNDKAILDVMQYMKEKWSDPRSYHGL